MTDDELQLAGRIRKVVRLAALPGMDEVAVKLNSSRLTWGEMAEVKEWALAFELAQRGGSVYALAHEYHEKLKKLC
jgi:hypothetical protein